MSDYAEIPYDSLPIPDSHPERLEALGYLFSLSAADPANCRVLELGCASGGNIVPMGYYLPQSRFLGIDLYANQIAEGQRLVDAVGLDNIELRQGDILDLDATALGSFDYVIVHGVYSWVPDAVRERILRLCAEVLAPDGIAYVSYNTLPGWRMRGMLRDVLGYATRDAVSVEQRLVALRSCLDRLGHAFAGLEAASARYLAAEIERLRARPVSYVVHEFLERENRPMLFADFVAAAMGAGLGYVCDTDLQTRYPEILGDGVTESLADVGDPVAREQYLDFVVNRNFRRSLLCGRDARPTAEPRLDRLETMHFAANLTPPRKLDLRRARAAPFTRPDGGTVDVHHPLTKAALGHLGLRHPDSASFDELAQLAAREVQAGGGQAHAGETGHLLSELYSLAVVGAVTLLRRPRNVARPVGATPALGPLARAQARTDARRVATRPHDVLALDAFGGRLAELLDGTRTTADVTQALLADLGAGRLTLEGVQSGSAGEPRTRDLLARNVERLVERFRRSGLLLDPQH